jgi:NAD(P)-dependent dehydrogenase (short-subunit alcohol dehydrogenase family)
MERVAVVTGAGRGIGREVAKGLGRRGYAVLATDVDEESARATAEAIDSGAWSMAQDVREPDGHRAAAAAAVERGRLEVWVNNAGVIRTQKVWDHSDDEVRLMAEANFLGVMWGSRAAVDAMRGQDADGAPRHLINMASMSSFGPVPGLAVYGATKHGVLGFSESLQGDLEDADLPIRVHAVCPDAVDTDMVLERRHDPESALIWSGPRLLSAEEVAEGIVGLLDSRRLVLVIPRWRGWLTRTIGWMPRAGLKLAGPLKRLGERQRQQS